MDKAMELVEQLATKLGVAAEYLWAVLIKQQYADGVIGIILAVFCMIVTLIVLNSMSKLQPKFKDEYLRLKEDREKNGTGYCGSRYVSSCQEDKYRSLSENIIGWTTAIVVCGIFFTIVFTVSGVKQLINPEYYALKEILHTISMG